MSAKKYDNAEIQKRTEDRLAKIKQKYRDLGFTRDSETNFNVDNVLDNKFREQQVKNYFQGNAEDEAEEAIYEECVNYDREIDPDSFEEEV